MEIIFYHTADRDVKIQLFQNAKCDIDLTAAAVGAGITGILFFLTLRRIDRIDRDADVEETQGEEEPHEENEATH